LSLPAYWRQSAAALALLCGLLGACTTTEVETYERVIGGRAEYAYVKPGTDFSRYRRLYPYPLEIYYQEGEGAPTPENLARMRAIFREAFLAAIGDDYEVVATPAPDALGVRASLVDLQESPVADDLPLAGRLRTVVASGRLTFLMELSDSVSGTVLARAADADRSQAAAAKNDGGDPNNWAQAEAAAERWASLFRAFLDDNLRQ
jgi:hypothetical protein